MLKQRLTSWRQSTNNWKLVCK